MQDYLGSPGLLYHLQALQPCHYDMSNDNGVNYVDGDDVDNNDDDDGGGDNDDNDDDLTLMTPQSPGSVLCGERNNSF